MDAFGQEGKMFQKCQGSSLNTTQNHVSVIRCLLDGCSRVRVTWLSWCLVLFSANAMAWSDHATLLWPLVRSVPQLQSATVAAEELSSFLDAEKDGLPAVLAEHEDWARQSLPHFSPTPTELAFSTGGANQQSDQLRVAFLNAIRVNPELAYPLYRQRTVEDRAPLGSHWLWRDLSFLSVGTSHVAVEYQPLSAGVQVAIAHVVATASDEPDLGMDIGLFVNNGTEFGRRYGFGQQPFGNPNLDYGSQAPFHMGFYHLDWLTRAAQPGLLQTYPLWRISLYDRLAQFAFETGHDYWGWRFMGWALHYIGDLTQPYHTVPLPGVTTPEALWLVVQGRTGEAIQLVSNRHGVLESYQYQRVQTAQESRYWEGPLLSAITGVDAGHQLHPEEVLTQLTKESADEAANLDAAIERWVPARFVSDPEFEWTGSGYEPDVVDLVAQDGGDSAVDALDEVVKQRMVQFSHFARGWINRGLAHAARFEEK